MLYKLIFVLGYNISNFFRKKKYRIYLTDLLLGIVVFTLIIGIPIILILNSNEIAILIIFKLNLSKDLIYETKTIFQFSLVVLQTLMIMFYFISKIHFVKEHSVSIEYLVDSYDYVSNINGRVKMILLRKVEEKKDEY